ncbi:cytoplasmic dynein with WD40 domain, partial [Quaeritorhiza haematococci]
MKSVRKTKTAENQLAQGRSLSTHSLRSANGDGPSGGGCLGGNGPGGPTNGEQGGGDDWLPPKVLLKPPNQLQLTEQELNEEFTRILNANNPHAPQNIARYNFKERAFKSTPNVDHLVVHFEFDGYLAYKEHDGASEQGHAEGAPKEHHPGEENPTAPAENQPQEGGAEGDAQQQPAATQQAATTTQAAPPGHEEKKAAKKNQFNFSQRAAQSTNNPLRDRSTNTEPPPHRTFSFNVNQWSIFDAYMEDTLQKERAKEKAKGGAGAGGGSGFGIGKTISYHLQNHHPNVLNALTGKQHPTSNTSAPSTSIPNGTGIANSNSNAAVNGTGKPLTLPNGSTSSTSTSGLGSTGVGGANGVNGTAANNTNSNSNVNPVHGSNAEKLGPLPKGWMVGPGGVVVKKYPCPVEGCLKSYKNT